MLRLNSDYFNYVLNRMGGGGQTKLKIQITQLQNEPVCVYMLHAPASILVDLLRDSATI